ncbi:LOW QUALITY PROTEIN: hypothetical protein Dda_2475 [Drechslerella dactyloides]|uniref:Calcineurin-like phosphoesterase domain-containing protein n=1 Tax=Drechslerella dactyloides TaxID=74499 RepID=A0AAD6J0H3_DREDA|nr:LOW QUALITY PROTEIN: hypothetical protein Dda_2475 [Drechslerella dactyloides]
MSTEQEPSLASDLRPPGRIHPELEISQPDSGSGGDLLTLKGGMTAALRAGTSPPFPKAVYLHLEEASPLPIAIVVIVYLNNAPGRPGSLDKTALPRPLAMSAVYALLRPLLVLLTAISIISTASLYLYPLLLNCSYPNPAAPFRLLTLADPQIEGNTSIFSIRYAESPILLRELRRLRKTLDLWGNDFYLRHIYQTLHTTIPALTSRFSFLPQGLTHPTHTVVLGDLIGSQWIDDDEFASRGQRYWQTVFPDTNRLPENAVDESKRISPATYSTIHWPNTLINVAGNHDIGYSGDIRPDLIQRFESTYGPVNYAFTVPFPAVNGTVPAPDGIGTTSVTVTPSLRIINLNSLNIDSPAREYSIQMETYNFMNSLFGDNDVWDGSVATVLLTHVPLYKPEGVCVDGPMNEYYEEYYGGVLKEQNHLSRGASDMLLGELFGERRVGEDHVPQGKEMGIILTGHDHEGCDIVHWLGEAEKKDGEKLKEEKEWKAGKWGERKTGLVGERDIWVREVTVRSMMGEFGGNAGLTSAWFDTDTMSWRFEYSTCPVGTQHIWWTVHVVDLITVALGIAYAVLPFTGVLGSSRRKVVVPKVIVTEANGGAKSPAVEKKTQ